MNEIKFPGEEIKNCFWIFHSTGFNYLERLSGASAR